MTLWFAAVLSLLAVQVFFVASGQSRATHRELVSTQQTYLLEAGVSYAIGVLRTGFEPKGAPVRRAFTLAGKKVLVAIANETGKIDLNTAAAEHVEAVLTAAGLPANRIAPARDALLDWIDADDVSRGGGSERVRYQGKGLRYTPANGPLETMGALALIPELQDGEIERLRQFATIHRPRRPVHLDVAALRLRELLDSQVGTRGVRTALADTLSITVGFADHPASLVAYVRRGADHFKLLAIERL